MPWMIEYYEQVDTAQPAEVFADAVYQTHPKLVGKLARIAVALESSGPRLGGGLIEPCHGYPGLWEIRAIFSQTLARELFGFDDQRVVLLHGYLKRAGQPASDKDLAKAADYWRDYLRTRRVSPPASDTRGSEESDSGDANKER
jgi:hypothetical protein